MKKIFFIIMFTLIVGCSNKINTTKPNINTIQKQKNLMSLTFKEYDIFVNEYAQKSEYPNLIDE